MSKKLFLAIVLLSLSALAAGHDKAGHEGQGHAHGLDKPREKNQGNEHGDAHGHGHEHEEDDHEESPQVGPDKGILSADENEGFRLSPEAEKNFGLKRRKAGAATFDVPRSALVKAGNEVNLFRYRGGLYKRVEFETVRKNESSLTVRSKELTADDEVVVAGLGFLRIAEIAAFGGAPEGHSH